MKQKYNENQGRIVSRDIKMFKITTIVEGMEKHQKTLKTLAKKKLQKGENKFVRVALISILVQFPIPRTRIEEKQKNRKATKMKTKDQDKWRTN